MTRLFSSLLHRDATQCQETTTRAAGSSLNQTQAYSRQYTPWHIDNPTNNLSSELLKTLGLPFIVDDLYSLDPDSLAALQPIHALIFLFKYINPSNSTTTPNPNAGSPDPYFPGFFAHQTVNNACATLAVLNALGNIPPPSSSSSHSPSSTKTKTEEYNALMSFAAPLDPTSRGLVITSADWLREAHNALSPPSAISLDGLGLERGTEDVSRFIWVFLLRGGLALRGLDGMLLFHSTSLPPLFTPPPSHLNQIPN